MNTEHNHIHTESVEEIRLRAEEARVASRERHEQISKKNSRNRRIATVIVALALLPAGAKGVEAVGKRIDNQAKVADEANRDIQEGLEERAQEKYALSYLPK